LRQNSLVATWKGARLKKKRKVSEKTQKAASETAFEVSKFKNPLDFLTVPSDYSPKDDSDEAAALAKKLPDPSQALERAAKVEIGGISSPPKPTAPRQSSPHSPSLPQGAESVSIPRVSPHPIKEPPKPPPAYTPTLQDEVEYQYREFIIDKNGVARHAGSDVQEGGWITQFKSKAERSLYLFCKGVLNRHFLTERLHRPVCQFLQKVPAFRKLVLMPREHAKTAIVSGGLPLHIIIQPAATNIYFPGLDGSECRIMLAGENMRMAKKNLRVLESIHTENKLFRALWPHKVWDEPRRQSKVWNQEALIFPRDNEWPDPTIWALGVDGAVTGARPNVQIKDDLVSIEAANSDVVMDSAIEWHKASRALMDTYEVETGLQSLEFIIGTRWAVYDLYSYIIDNDPSVEVIDEKFHQIIRDGKILWPEKHTVDSIDQLRREHGSMFYLLYLNSAADPELVDFDLELVREFKLVNGVIVFDEDERDERLTKDYDKTSDSPAPPLKVERGTLLTPGLLNEMMGRNMYFKIKNR
jgi:hypothetical protein